MNPILIINYTISFGPTEYLNNVYGNILVFVLSICNLSVNNTPKHLHGPTRLTQIICILKFNLISY